MYFFLLFLQVSAVCPVVNCAPNSIGVCGVFTNNSIYMNSNGCTATTFCELLTVQTWFNNGGSYLYCQEFNSVDTSNYPNVGCGTRDEEEMLLNDIHPRRCNSSADCVLRNLQQSPCQCGMDGYQYCQPQWGSEVFEEYWMYCQVNNNSMPYSIYQYWQATQLYYSAYVFAPNCAQAVINEFQVLNTPPGYGSFLSSFSVLFLLLFF